MISLFDTATGTVRELALREPGKVSIYLCGPTVYGPAHLGHGRATITYDILRRYLTWTGLDVTLVSNITDIDDKIIATAAAGGVTEPDVAAFWEADWFATMDRFGVQHPTMTPHATEFVPAMIEFIAGLLATGAAYRTADGIYLDTSRVDDYGLLAGGHLDGHQAGGGDRALIGATDKRHPGDFALWKAARPGDPSWDAPFGAGRPGWHSECVVMSLGLLGDGFDLHAGGADLKFPHHENERAQAVVAGRRFANHWLHHEFVVDASGQKQAKSVGNYTTLHDLAAGHDPRALRVVLLHAHYRSSVHVGADSLTAAEVTLNRFDRLATRARPHLPAAVADQTVLDEFRRRMDDDMNTPQVMALLHDTLSWANGEFDAGDVTAGAALTAALIEAAAALGLSFRDDLDSVPADVAAALDELDAARARNDYSAADAIRARLTGDGWQVATTPAGSTATRR